MTSGYLNAQGAIDNAILTELDAAFSRERVGPMELLEGADFAEGVSVFLEKRVAAFR